MNTTDQDIVLWERFRKGDKDAFASLFREFYGPMILFGSKFINDRQILEDTIHELFIELWQARSQAPVISVKAYLLKALKYKLLKVIRKTEQRQLLNEKNDSFFEWSHENFLIDQQESEEKKQHILSAITQLSNRQKEIIYLKYYQNLNYEEVSEIMNINYQVARNLLCQSIKTLKRLLLHTICLAIVFL